MDLPWFYFVWEVLQNAENVALEAQKPEIIENINGKCQARLNTLGR